MNKHLLLAILVLALPSCGKNDVAGPAAVTAEFNQEFPLYFQQQASLPQSAQPELTIAVTDLRISICPRNANCFLPDQVAPFLRITNAQGGTQQLDTFANSYGKKASDWIDTTSFRANGRRYLLTYVNWQVQGEYHAATKENTKLTFRISR